jgi:hypothetical protein
MTDNRLKTDDSYPNCWTALWADSPNWRTSAWFRYNDRVYFTEMSLNKTKYISKVKYKILTLRR